MNQTSQWIEVAVWKELPVNTGKTVRFRGLEIALFRTAAGKTMAVHNRCPHKNGVLAEGIVCDDHVFCPMHDRKIHLPTGMVQAPDTGCVRTFPVKIENGQVYVDIAECGAEAV